METTNEISTCVNCGDDQPTEEMFWVDEEPGQKIGYYCYECDANLITGIAGDDD